MKTDFSKYPGRKDIPGVYHKIINEIPKHDVYCELFAGSAGLFSKITTPPGVIILNDLFDQVCSFLTTRYPGAIVTNDCMIRRLKEIESNYTQEVFIFLDPPYLHDTRPCSVNLYEKEIDYQYHVVMLDTILKSKLKIAIIHPICSLYDSKLALWRSVDISIRYNKKTSYERLYMNYDKPVLLQDCNFVGASNIRRQQLRRIAKRWIVRIENMQDDEKQYILNKLKNEFL